MRFQACLPLVAAVGLTSLAPVSVQAADEGWVITSFHAAININPDSSLDITENIQVDFGDQAKHGIFRTIPVRYKYDSTHDRYYALKVESVTNGAAPVPYQAYTQGPDEVIKIGDPSRTVTGPNTYVITYSVKGAMNAFEDHDELFWNVDGALWPVPKQSVSATVTLPAAAYKAAACYQGATGSTEPCKYGNTTQSVTYSSTRRLASGEQMSVVVGLDKGWSKFPRPC